MLSLSSSKINTYLSTFNVFLILVGYQLVTSVFLPNTFDYDGWEDGLIVARAITIPYKIFALIIALLVIVLNWKQKIEWSIPYKLFFLFWFFLIIRIIYDFEIRIDYYVDVTKAHDTLFHIFFVCLIPTIAVWRSLPSIDFRLAFKLTFVGYIILVPVFYLNNPLAFTTAYFEQRVDGNIGMTSIAFGHYGVSLFLLSFYYLTNSRQVWHKILCYTLMLLGVFLMLRSGSRGPFVAMLIAVSLFFLARQQSKVLTLCMFGAVFLLVASMGDIIFDGIESISPAMARRITLSGSAIQYEELASGRLELYQTAINKFLDNPLFGDTFAILHSDGSFIYSHNMILDAFMGLGLFGGIIFLGLIAIAIWQAFQMIMFRDSRWWAALLLIQFIVFHLFSNCFYKGDALNALLVLVLYVPFKHRKFI